MRSLLPRVRLSYANVTATLALFIALGGSAYAVSKIRGKDIAPRTITAKNIKKGTLTGTEIDRGSITRSKLSRAVRSLLPEPGDSGSPGEDSFPPLDGRDGFDGEPGPPGDPGPPGSGCPAERGLLCGDADLPSGQTARLVFGSDEVLTATAYRTSCTTEPAGCDVLLAGSTPAQQAGALYASTTPRTYELTIVRGSTTVRRFTVTNGRPTALRTETNRWQLELTATGVVEAF